MIINGLYYTNFNCFDFILKYKKILFSSPKINKHTQNLKKIMTYLKKKVNRIFQLLQYTNAHIVNILKKFQESNDTDTYSKQAEFFGVFDPSTDGLHFVHSDWWQ